MSMRIRRWRRPQRRRRQRRRRRRAPPSRSFQTQPLVNANVGANGEGHFGNGGDGDSQLSDESADESGLGVGAYIGICVVVFLLCVLVVVAVFFVVMRRRTNEAMYGGGDVGVSNAAFGTQSSMWGPSGASPSASSGIQPVYGTDPQLQQQQQQQQPPPQHFQPQPSYVTQQTPPQQQFTAQPSYSSHMDTMACGLPNVDQALRKDTPNAFYGASSALPPNAAPVDYQEKFGGGAFQCQLCSNSYHYEADLNTHVSNRHY
eukprot:TRINITY_DN349_c0_g1_i1.p3 TRINITY_DN349_c0_g1~~TRINITY_DN349_c0_g1_i1.p3  ORF type:complete len:260 (-),score=140.97 TRINITY_DN349_c0_g1_i1:105-884(-)